MRIDSIHLQNYRCFSDLEVQFQPGMNVIAGVNGAGKSSLLMGVACALRELFDAGGHKSAFHFLQERDAQLAQAFHRPEMQGEERFFPNKESLPSLDARLAIANIGGRYRFEHQFPSRVIACGAVWDRDELTWGYGETETGPDIYLPYYAGHYLDQKYSLSPDLLPISPLVLFYRAQRSWGQAPVSELTAATAKPSRLDGYQNWWNASADGTALQAWVIAKCLERFQTSSETGIAFDAITDDELALVNGALRQALPEIWGLRYDMKRKSLLVEWAGDGTGDRDAMPFELLSDGQRTLIALLSDIARRMCLLNPQLGDEVITKTPGVVLIDELDMHLHPEWQRRLTRGLKAAFPALQFIAASHSPQVLGELQPQEIILLRPEGVRQPDVSYGLDSSMVLKEVMEASTRTQEVAMRINELFAALTNNDLTQARQYLQALEKQAPGIAELSAAKALLKRKEVLGR